MNIESMKTTAEFLLAVVGILAAAVAGWTYWKNSKRERTRWLFELYQRFYEREELKPMRARIESGETGFAKEEKDSALLEQLDDYLNFFEFIAYLHERNELKKEEVAAMFDYPLRKIARDEAVSQYLSQPEYGYEGVRELLKDLGYAK